MRIGLTGLIAVLGFGYSGLAVAEDHCKSLRVKLLDATEKSTIAPAPQMGPYITALGDQLPIWFIKRTDLRMGVLSPSGKWKTPVKQVLKTTPQRSGVRVVANKDCAGVASVLWGEKRGNRYSADISFSSWCPGSGFSKEIAVDPNPQLDNDPEIAAGPPGTYAIAWTRSPSYFTNHLYFALVENGEVTVKRELVRDAHAEGMSVVFTGKEYVVIYSRSTVGNRRGLVAIRTGLDGKIIASGEIMRGRSWLPMAAWDGTSIAVSFVWQGRGLGFLRIAPDGQVVGKPRSIDWHKLSRVAFRPSSLIPYKDGYLVGLQRDAFQHSAKKSSASQARVIYLTADGSRVTHPAVIGKHRRGSSSPSLGIVQDRILGAYFQAPWSGDDQIGTFEVTCIAGRPPRVTREFKPEKPKDPCQAVVQGMPVGRFLPMREVFEVSALGDDLAVASLGNPGPDGKGKRSLSLSRMTRQGIIKWSQVVEQDDSYYRPALAIDEKGIGLVYPKSDGIYFAAYSHDGNQKQAPQRIKGAKGSPCLAPAPDGYLMAVMGLDLKGTLFGLDKNGKPTGDPVEAPSGMRCALSTADDGFILAVTRPGKISGTNFLYTQKLDQDGRPKGPEHTIERKFARSPVLLRQTEGHTLLWTNPLRHRPASEFRSAILKKDGSIASKPDTYGWYNNVGGWGLIPGGQRARIVYGTYEDYIERPICPDKPGPYPPPPLPPHRH
jgi:hypothetical protein